MTLVRPAKTAVRLPELKEYGEGGHFAGDKSGLKYLLEKRSSYCANARRPWRDTTSRHHVEVPGALLDGCWLYAASVLFCKCGLPPYARVVPVDASSHALAM